MKPSIFFAAVGGGLLATAGLSMGIPSIVGPCLIGGAVVFIASMAFSYNEM